MQPDGQIFRHSRNVDLVPLKPPEPDPCLQAAKDLAATDGDSSILEGLYQDWREKFDDILSGFTPRPAASRDSSADNCEMLGTNVGFTITRDGQFSGYKVRPDKPNLSFAVMHQMWSEKSSLKPYSVVPKPDEFDMQHPFKCHDLQVQDWKTWDPFMPGSKNNPNPLPQFGSRFIALPCDPTAPAFAGVGGCWYEEPSPENGNQLTDGCGGGGGEIDRDYTAKLLECVRKAVVKKGEELCL